MNNFSFDVYINEGVQPVVDILGPYCNEQIVTTAPVGSPVSFRSMASDPDNGPQGGGILQYEWKIRQPDGTEFTTNSGSTIDSYVPGLPGNYNVELKVTDDEGMTKTATKNFQAVECEITSVEFEALESPVDANPAFAGTGKRIFPDRPTVEGELNYKKVRVKATTNCPCITPTIHFRSFDVDDPTSNTAPLDANGSDGGDNRDPDYPAGNFGGVLASQTSATADENGNATVDFETGMSPGDNYKIGASLSFLDLFNISSTDETLNSEARSMLNGRVKLTEKLYVWRRVHVEVDSMGVIENNHVEGTVLGAAYRPRERATLLTISPEIDEPLRFENGIIDIQGVGSFRVIKNTQSYILIKAKLRLTQSYPFKLYDDDNLNGMNNGDEGYDIPPPNLSLVQDSDAPESNIYAHAYIRPEYNALEDYADDDVSVDVNVEGDEGLLTQIVAGRGTSALESNDFWVVYIQGAYQADERLDWDPNGEPGSPPGLTGTYFPSSDDGDTAPIGGVGSLIYQETQVDKKNSTEVQGTVFPGGVVAHEIGHQFGLRGDNCVNLSVDPNCRLDNRPDYGIMTYGSSSHFFHPSHLNLLRLRVLSPGANHAAEVNDPLSSNNDSSFVGLQRIEQLNVRPMQSEVKVQNQHLLAGDLDTTFDLDGKATADLNPGKDNFAYAVATQSDGKIVVAGDANNGADTDFGIVRYSPDGSLDTAFGNGGKAILAFGSGFDFVGAVTVQSDGNIIVAGYTETTPTNIDFALMRLNPNGTVDGTFGTGGKVTTDIGGIDDEIAGLKLQSDGKILVVGSTDNGIKSKIALARYNTGGTLDTTFDSDGIAVTSFNMFDQSASDVLLQPDGKIIIAGQAANGTDTDFFVARYESNGTIDSTFGVGGKTITDFSNSEDGVTSMAIQPDGQIVVGGFTGNFLDPDFALTRYNPDGTLDSAFGAGGKVVTDFVGNAEFVNDIAIRNNGIIVAVGHSYNNNNSDLAVAEYLPSGILNSNFGTGGKAMTPIGTSDDFGIATAIQSDNKIVVAGASFNGNDDDFAVARYLAASPTAAAASVSGRVLTRTGTGVFGALVTLTDSNSAVMLARTNAFGYYSFEDVAVGATYVLSASSKRYQFLNRLVNVTDSLTDVDLVAE